MWTVWFYIHVLLNIKQHNSPLHPIIKAILPPIKDHPEERQGKLQHARPFPVGRSCAELASLQAGGLPIPSGPMTTSAESGSLRQSSWDHLVPCLPRLPGAPGYLLTSLGNPWVSGWGRCLQLHGMNSWRKSGAVGSEDRCKGRLVGNWSMPA